MPWKIWSFLTPIARIIYSLGSAPVTHFGQCPSSVLRLTWVRSHSFAMQSRDAHCNLDVQAQASIVIMIDVPGDVSFVVPCMEAGESEAGPRRCKKCGQNQPRTPCTWRAGRGGRRACRSEIGLGALVCGGQLEVPERV